MTEKTNSAGHGRHVPIAPALVCPKCHGAMRTYVRGGIVVELCEDCRGIFLDKGELERLVDVEGDDLVRLLLLRAPDSYLRPLLPGAVAMRADEDRDVHERSL